MDDKRRASLYYYDAVKTKMYHHIPNERVDGTIEELASSIATDLSWSEVGTKELELWRVGIAHGYLKFRAEIQSQFLKPIPVKPASDVQQRLTASVKNYAECTEKLDRPKDKASIYFGPLVESTIVLMVKRRPTQHGEFDLLSAR
jgi:hypothetical protein